MIQNFIHRSILLYLAFRKPVEDNYLFDVGELDQDSKATYVVTAQCSSAQIAIALVMETLTKSALSGLIECSVT